MVKYFVISVSLIFSLNARTDVAKSKATIVAILRQKNPAAIDEFHNFFKKYDHSVTMFFDRNDTDSLVTHIKRMEGEVAELDDVIDAEQIASVRALLQEQRDHLIELLAIFRNYIGSHNALSLAFKVRKFKFLLPPEVRKRGNLSLYRSLKHRLAM